jgi:hypothetical protein
MIQNIKKICTDESSDAESTSLKKQHLPNRSTDILDPAYKLPFKYGWKRELVRIFLLDLIPSSIFMFLINTFRFYGLSLQ